MTGKRFLPFDIATMSHPDFESDADEYGWITAYPAYHFISYGMVNAVCDAARGFHDQTDARIATGAKLYEILIDLQRIARIALDLHGVRESGAEPRFDPDSSRLLAFFIDPALAPSHFFDPYWRTPKTGELRRIARRVQLHGRFLLTIVSQKSWGDLLSVNDLLSEYLESRDQVGILLPRPRPSLASPKTSSRLVEEVTNALLAAFQGALPPELSGGATIARRVAVAARSCIARHIAEAERDLRQLRSSLPRRPIGSALASGTPKYYGRLLAALYAEAGRRVIRFAHGGERGVFADLHWAVSELTFCDEYYLHGRGEAALVAARAADGGMARADQTETRFASLGSRKHQAILGRAKRRPAGPRSGKVMYVPGSYLGEIAAHFPAMRPPDPVTYEWQRWLLPRLKSLGYDVSVKVHPKGVCRDRNLLADRCSEFVLGRFDPNAHDVDCYLFDFAGTAFMDALASGVGVVLLDHGVRPLDPVGAELLDARVARVPCHFDGLNRLRVDLDRLAAAIETAADSHPLERAAAFVDSYYAA